MKSDETFTMRLKAVLGNESIRSFADRAGISHASMGGYLRGENDPTRSAINKIALASGVNIAWLMTGEGPMHPGDAAPPAVPEAHVIDPVLLGRCLDAIHKLFQELNMKAPSTALGEEAALVYQDVAASGLQSLEEQLGAIRVLITQRRRALLTAPPGKHEGSA